MVPAKLWREGVSASLPEPAESSRERGRGRQQAKSQSHRLGVDGYSAYITTKIQPSFSRITGSSGFPVTPSSGWASAHLSSDKRTLRDYCIIAVRVFLEV
jgi:hypothetical protein